MRAASLVRVKSNFSDGAGRRETEDEAPIRAVIEREVVTPEPDDDACRGYYRPEPRALLFHGDL